MRRLRAALTRWKGLTGTVLLRQDPCGLRDAVSAKCETTESQRLPALAQHGYRLRVSVQSKYGTKRCTTATAWDSEIKDLRRERVRVV